MSRNISGENFLGEGFLELEFFRGNFPRTILDKL